MSYLIKLTHEERNDAVLLIGAGLWLLKWISRNRSATACLTELIFGPCSEYYRLVGICAIGSKYNSLGRCSGSFSNWCSTDAVGYFQCLTVLLHCFTMSTTCALHMNPKAYSIIIYKNKVLMCHLLFSSL